MTQSPGRVEVVYVQNIGNEKVDIEENKIPPNIMG